MRIVLIGPQGCGKGTLAGDLVKILKVPTISLGEIFRSEATKGTKLGLKAKSYMDKGALVPTDLAFDILKSRLSEPDAKNGFILDAFPRTLEQAELLDKVFDIDKVIHIDVPKDVVIKRISTRRSCKKCGKIYSTTFYKKPVCECGGELYVRDDDTPEAIEKRLSIYKESIEPILKFYRKKGNLVTLDGSGKPEDTLKQALEVL